MGQSRSLDITIKPAVNDLVQYLSAPSNFKYILIVLVAAWAVGITSWDIDNPGYLANYLTENALTEALRASLIRRVLWITLGFLAAWLGYSLLVARVNAESLDEALSKDALTFLPGSVTLAFQFKHLTNVEDLFFHYLFVASVGSILGLKVLLMKPQLRFRAPRRWGLVVVVVAVLLHTAMYSWMTITRFLQFDMPAFDFAVFDQMIWNTLNGRWLYTPTKMECFLGEHFSPILLALVPFYRLWNHPETLLVLESSLYALGALPIYLLASEKLKSEFLGVAFSAAYLLSPVMHSGNQYPFHMVSFEPLIIGFALYFMYKHNSRAFALCLGLSLLIKEDIFLSALFMGLYILWVRKQRLRGLTVVALSAIWGILVLKVFIPRISGGNYIFISAWYQSLGGSFGSILRTVLLNPLYVFKNLLTSEHLIGITKLLIPVGIFSTMAGWDLLLIVPSFSALFLSSNSRLYRVEIHYGVAVLPFLFSTAIVGTGNLLRGVRAPTNLGPAVGAFLLGTTLLVNRYIDYGSPPIWFTGLSPLYKGFGPETFRITRRHQLGKHFVNLTPAEGSVSAQERLVAHLSHRKEIYQYPMTNEADYIFLDKYGGIWPMSRDEYERSVKELLLGSNYGTVAFEDGYLLLKRGYANTLNAAAYIDFFDTYDIRQMGTRIGVVTYDDDSRIGRALRVTPEDLRTFQKPEGPWLAFGPYATYPEGDYLVKFRLKVDSVDFEGPVGRLDIAQGVQPHIVFVEREILASDFAEANTYHEIALCFHNDVERSLEFRVFYHGTVSLWFDWVQIVRADCATGRVLDSRIASLPAKNILANGGFEAWSSGPDALPDGWQEYFHGQGSISHHRTDDTSSDYEGNYAYRGTVSNPVGNGKGIAQTVPVEPGTIYSIAVTGKASPGGNWWIKVVNGAGTHDLLARMHENTEYERKSYFFTPGESDTTVLALLYSSVDGTFYVDSAVIEVW